jgi:hypothetical protein
MLFAKREHPINLIIPHLEQPEYFVTELRAAFNH